MERFFTGRELVNTSSRLERNAAIVGYASSPTYTAYVDMTLTQSKVKVTGLLNFRQLAKPCMLAAITAAPLRGFLVEFPSRKLSREFKLSPVLKYDDIQMAIFR